MSAASDLLVVVGANVSQFMSAMESMLSECEKVVSRIEDRFESFSNLGSRLAGLGAGLTAGITLPLEEIGRHALEAAASFEQTQIAFETFTGSAQAAAKVTKDLYTFAAQTPFQVGGVLQASRTLLAMQFAAKDVIPILRTLGDTASGLGLGQEGLERLVFHLGQIRSQGAIDGHILREMGQMGINAGEMIADAMGKSVAEMRKMVHDKAIDANTAINALLAGMNNQFGGMMKSQMSSLLGMWTNFKDQATLTLVDIGNALLPVAKAVVDFGTQALSAVKGAADAFGKLSPPIVNAALALAGMAAALGPIIAGFGGLLMVVGPVAALFGVGAGAVLGWAAAIGVGVAAIAGLATWVHDHWSGVTAAVRKGWDGIGDLWNATLGITVRSIGVLFETFYSKTRIVWGAIGSALNDAWKSITAAAKAFWADIQGIFHGFINLIEKIPGVTKLLSMGEAFTKADEQSQHAKQMAANLAEAMKTLRLGSEAVKLSDPSEVWNEAHRQRVERYTKAVQVMDEGLKRNAVSAAEAAEAHRRLNQVLNEKMPKSVSGDGEGAGGGAQTKTEFKPVIDKDIVKEIEFHAALARMRAAYGQFVQDFASGKIEAESLRIGESFERMGRDGKKNLMTLDEARKVMEEASVPVDRLAKDYETLGVTSSYALQKTAEAAREAYEEIVKLGKGASDEDIRNAWIAMQEAAIKAAEATDKSVSAVQRLDLAMAKLKADWSENGGIAKILSKNTFEALGSGFDETIQKLLMGTAKFKNAWIQLGQTMMKSFASSLAQITTHFAAQLLQMFAKWAEHEAAKTAAARLGDRLTVASHAQAAAQTQQIDTVTAIKKTLTDAKSAATGAYQALVGIPIIGPIIAPPAAVAAFAAVMALGAVSAEGGAVLPNYNTIGMLHPNEMVLPAPISMGLQNMIANGGGRGGNGGGHTYQIQNTNNFRGKTNRTTAANSGKIVGNQVMKQIRNNAIPRMR